jgi:hypothetical protein
MALITVVASDGGIGGFVILRLEAVSNLGRLVDISVYEQLRRMAPPSILPTLNCPSTRWNDSQPLLLAFSHIIYTDGGCHDTFFDSIQADRWLRMH